MIARTLLPLFVLASGGAGCFSNPTPHPQRKPPVHESDPSHNGKVTDGDFGTNVDDLDPGEIPAGNADCDPPAAMGGDATAGDATAGDATAGDPEGDAATTACDGSVADSGPEGSAVPSDRANVHDP